MTLQLTNQGAYSAVILQVLKNRIASVLLLFQHVNYSLVI